MKKLSIINWLWLQGLWLAAVMHANETSQDVTLLIFLIGYVIHLFFDGWHNILAATVFGLLAGVVAESLLLSVGVITYHNPSSLSAMGIPFWIFLLWISLAISFRHSMKWIYLYPGYGFLAGIIMGPLSYVAAERLHAIEFNTDPWISFISLGALWGILLPTLATAVCLPMKAKRHGGHIA